MTTQTALKETSNVSNFSQKNTTLSPADELENIREDMKSLREDLASLTSVMTQLSTREMNRVAGNVADAGKELLDNTAEAGRKTIDRAESAVKERPLVYVGSAFGLGLLAAALLKRR